MPSGRRSGPTGGMRLHEFQTRPRTNGHEIRSVGRVRHRRRSVASWLLREAEECQGSNPVTRRSANAAMAGG